ncbi:MAG TPA: hypothetical protein VHW00_16875 [Thermoanaerobaculia bacterium]|nr:hypothetical protein [Thermoanaerobaculia bacterium]
MTARRLTILFVALALLHLLPVWRVGHVPTGDGPAHVYNAMVMRELFAGTPEFARVYEIDWRPHPNWLGHLLLVLAMSVAPPVMAEKLVVSLIVLTFIASLWAISGVVDVRNRVYAILALPLTFHMLLQLGFYNFTLGTALMLFSLAARSRLARALLLTLTYFAHPIPTAVALLFCGVRWLFTSRDWRDLLPFVPATLLLGWFAMQPGAQSGMWSWKGALLWEPLARVMVLFTLDLRQLTFGLMLGITFALLFVVTLLVEKRSSRDAFLAITLAAIALYLAAPIGMNGDLVLKARFLLFPYLVVLPWLTPKLARAPLAILFALVAIGNVFFIRDGWKRHDKQIERALAPMHAATPLQTFVPVVFDRSSPPAPIGVVGHVSAYGAIEHRLIDLGNYEAATGYFPVAFKTPVDIFALESKPADYEPAATFVYTWKMPPGTALETKLEAAYARVAGEGDARLYRRISSSSAPPAVPPAP